MCGILTLAAVSASSLHAEEKPVSFGFIGGVPVTDWYNINNQNLTGDYHSADRRYEFGLTGELHMKWVRFEVDGIVKRLGYDDLYFGNAAGTSFNNQAVTATQWEIPGLFKYNFALGHYRPWVGVGASLRHISTIKDSYTGIASYPVNQNNSPALSHRNTPGALAALGITFKYGPFEISPQARYTRWANESFESGAQYLKSNLDQGDVLVSFTF